MKYEIIIFYSTKKKVRKYSINTFMKTIINSKLLFKQKGLII